MSTTNRCVECPEPCTRATPGINCVKCGGLVHYKCVSARNKSMTTQVLDTIKNSGGSMLFRCKNCLQNVPTDSNNELALRIDKLESTINKLSELITITVLSDLKSIKEEMAQCAAKSTNAETLVSEVRCELKEENEQLRRLLYRNDIVINGLLPNKTSEELLEAVTNIGKRYDIELSTHDINSCTYIKKGKSSVLLKLNSTFKRDMLMKKYFASMSLKLNEICEVADIESRIYLNDHLTPSCSKLNFICRKLLKEKKIKKFKIIYKNTPEVKITLNNGEEKVLSVEQVNMWMKNIETSSTSLENAAACHTAHSSHDRSAINIIV